MRPEIYWIDGPWPGRLAILARPRGSDWLIDELAGWKNAGLDVVVSLLTRGEDSELGLSDEGELAQQYGLTFISFPISDYSVPTSDSSRCARSATFFISSGFMGMAILRLAFQRERGSFQKLPAQLFVLNRVCRRP